MGQRYASNAVIDDGTPFPAFARDPDLYHAPTSHPGATLPHVWLESGVEQISTLDLCAYDRFTLITGTAGRAWHEAADEVGRAMNVPIEAVTVSLGGENNDVLGAWTRKREIADDGCLLVRPDRIVAWRCPTAVSDPAHELQRAMTAIFTG
jgi:2,4-dichlorophenol 6-monooxygenase